MSQVLTQPIEPNEEPTNEIPSKDNEFLRETATNGTHAWGRLVCFVRGAPNVVCKSSSKNLYR